MLWNPEKRKCLDCNTLYTSNRHTSVAKFDPFDKAWLVTCSSCRDRKLDAEIAQKYREAWQAASDKKGFFGHPDMIKEFLVEAELAVLREELFDRQRLLEYWRRVKEKLED